MEQSVIPFWSDGHSYNSSPIPGDVRDKVVELNLTSVIIIEIDRSPIGPGKILFEHIIGDARTTVRRNSYCTTRQGSRTSRLAIVDLILDELIVTNNGIRVIKGYGPTGKCFICFENVVLDDWVVAENIQAIAIRFIVFDKAASSNLQFMIAGFSLK